MINIFFYVNKQVQYKLFKGKLLCRIEFKNNICI